MSIGHLWATLWIVTLAMAAACGGKLGEDADEPSEPPPIAEDPSPSPSKQETLPSGTMALGDCELGFDPRREPRRRCDWVFADRCYEDKLAACACACPPGSRNTFCASEFPVENGRIEVSCF